jgi:hypothetical protein
MKLQATRFFAASLLIAGASLSVITPARADASPPDVFTTANDVWSFEVVPYAWLPGIKGDITVNGRTADIDQSFSDIFKTVKFAADGLAIARYNNWLIYTQLDFFNLSTTQLKDAPTRGSFSTKELFYTAAAGYRINGWASGQTFDILLGAQGLHLDNTLSFYQFGSANKTTNVVDGIVMLRPSIQFTQHWIFNPSLSFGAGDNNHTYQLQPQFQYQFNSTWELRFGYRKMHYKFTGKNNDNNELNLNLGGPIIGFGATF